MDLDFTDEQTLLRETTGRICADHSGTDILRKLEDDPCGYSSEFWQALSAVGLCGLRIEENYGGVGMGAMETAVVYEELGRALAPSPHYASSILSARLLSCSSSSDLAAKWLPSIADGSAIVVPAWQETDACNTISGITSKAEREGDRFILQGEKILVPFANIADMIVVIVNLQDGPAALMIPVSDLPVAPREMENHADQSLFALSLDGVSVSVDQLLNVENMAATWDRVMLEGLIYLSAQAAGGAARILEISIEYAKQREQFGQPIGAFQAISHYLADCATEIAGARYLAYQAAWACDRGLPFAKLALMAKWQTTAVFCRAAKTGVQIHGGIGYSLEADPQLFYRRSKHQQLMYWDPRYLEQRIAEEVF